jgi:hypothetical protein
MAIRFIYVSFFVLQMFSHAVAQEHSIRSVDDLSNASVLLYQPISSDSAKTGTGNIIVANHKYFILTAAHVVEGFNLRGKIGFHLSGDKPRLSVDAFVSAFKQQNTKDGDAYFFSMMMYVMHEYGHFGDHVSNNDWTSGEVDKDDPSTKQLARSSDTKLPIQMATSPAQHRGADIDNAILFGRFDAGSPVSYLNNGLPSQSTLHTIKNSKAYLQWLAQKK